MQGFEVQWPISLSIVPAVLTISRITNSAALCFRCHPFEGLMLHRTPVFDRQRYRAFGQFEGLVDAAASYRAKGIGQDLG
jgi:hypothetical protein